MMTLDQLPTAILEAHTRYVSAQQRVATLTTDLKNLTTEFEAQAGNNDTLTNQVQRKAYVASMVQNDQGSVDLKQALNSAQEELQRAELHLEFLRNQFAVTKLTYRRETALIENDGVLS